MVVEASNDPTPRIWVIWGHKAGDNAQISTIARQLPWPVEYRRVCFKPRYEQAKPFFNASLRHLDLNASDKLSGPWPDLVITAGRRPAMAALWVKKRSGGRCKIVLVGRPKRWLHVYDLIVASSQYQLPQRSNTISLDLPLLEIDTKRLHAARSQWLDRLTQLPRPVTALMIGGATRPYVLDAKQADILMQQARALTGDKGTLYVVTSRRTGEAVCRALRELLPSNAIYYDSHAPASGTGTDNPYLGLLACADQIIVTSDSISMTTEAIRAGFKPYIFQLPRRADPLGASLDWLLGGLNWQAPNLWQRFCARVGVASFPRDLQHFHSRLSASGLTRSLSSASVAAANSRNSNQFDQARDANAPTLPTNLIDDLERVVTEIADLLGDRRVESSVVA